ncbi:MAG: hypothetical protein KF831_06980 [Acidobacteria bacterium]|nr:hypothetical protein [Acidobacteriota bacterium]
MRLRSRAPELGTSISTEELVRLYLDKGLSCREIAAHLGVSGQAVHYQLKKAGIELRSVGGVAKKLDVNKLRRLYLTEKRPLRQIAAELGITTNTIYDHLERHGIPRRSDRAHPVKYPELRKLKVGEHIDLPRPDWKRPQTSFYTMAEIIGFRVSCRTINEKTMRVKRIK